MVVTCQEDATADLVIGALNARDAMVTRVDPADIGEMLTFGAQIGAGTGRWTGRLRTPSRQIALEDVRAVYYRRPGTWRFHHLDPQARAFAMAEARYGLKGLLTSLSDCLYVNHPARNEWAEHKPGQLQAACRVGLDVPDTLITNEREAVVWFGRDHDPMVYKSMRGVPYTPDGRVGAIWTQRVGPEEVDDTVALTAHLFQAEISKAGDARVTVVGPHMFASEITSPSGELDWRRGDWAALKHTPIQVPSPVASALRAYLDRFGLVFGCFDFALEEPESGTGERRWVFLECNPNGQWGWLPDAPAIAEAIADTLLKGQSA